MPNSAQTLMISFIGMRTQEVKAQSVLNVVLKPESEMIDEVMVVAYGTAKKSSFTGSATAMKAGEINTQKTSLVNCWPGEVCFTST